MKILQCSENVNTARRQPQAGPHLHGVQSLQIELALQCGLRLLALRQLLPHHNLLALGLGQRRRAGRLEFALRLGQLRLHEAHLPMRVCELGLLFAPRRFAQCVELVLVPLTAQIFAIVGRVGVKVRVNENE